MTRKEISAEFGIAVTAIAANSALIPAGKKGSAYVYDREAVLSVYLPKEGQALDESLDEALDEVPAETPAESLDEALDEALDEVPAEEFNSESISEPKPQATSLVKTVTADPVISTPVILNPVIPLPEPFEWLDWDKDRVITWIETFIAAHGINSPAAMAQMRDPNVSADRCRSYGIKLLNAALPLTHKTIYVNTPELFAEVPIFDSELSLHIDTETYLIDPNHAPNAKAVHWQDSQVRLIQIYAPSINTTFVFDVYMLVKAGAGASLYMMVDDIASLSIPKYAHNAVFDGTFITKTLQLERPIDLRCTYVLSAVLKKGLHQYYPGAANSLDSCLKSIGINFYEGMKAMMQKSDFSPHQNLILNQDQIDYASKDSIAVYLVAASYLHKAKMTKNLPRLRHEWIGDLACQSLTRTGFPIDIELLQDTIDRYSEAQSLLRDVCSECLATPYEVTTELGFPLTVTPKKILPTELDKVKKYWLTRLNIQPFITGSDKTHVKLQTVWTNAVIELIDAAIALNQNFLKPLVKWLSLQMSRYSQTEPYVISKKKTTAKKVTVSNCFDLVEAGFDYIIDSESKNPKLLWMLVKSEFAMYMAYIKAHTLYNQVSTQKTTLQSIEQFSYPDAGGVFRSHAIYSTTGGRMSNGRTSAKDSPLQIIPKPGDANTIFDLPSVKSMFRPAPGKVFLVWDWAGCHGTVAAALAGESKIFDLGREGLKFHFLTVQGFLKSLYNIDATLSEIKDMKGDKKHPQHKLVSNLYAMAKNVYYSYINYASPASIQRSIFDRSGVIVSIEECKDYLAATKQTYSNITTWMEKQVRQANARAKHERTITGNITGLVTTLPSIEGALIKFPSIVSTNPYTGVKKASFYPPALTSSLYQNWEGAILKMFMRIFTSKISDPTHEWYGSELCHFNHDELVFSVESDRAFGLAYSILGALETFIRRYIPEYEGECGDKYEGYIKTDHW